MFTHNFDPVLIDLYFFELRWYSLAYIFGILIGWIYAKKIIKYLKTSSNLSYLKIKDFDDFIPYLVIGIILGGRLGYVLIYNFDFYIKNIHEILYVWNGGMSFHGGLVGIIIATVIFTSTRKIHTFVYLDIISCVAPIGLFLGRISNFINGELYGKATNLLWGVIFPNAGTFARHPSQIYEAILEGIVLFILINFFALKKQLLLKAGYVSGLFLIFYSIARIIGENFREPDKHLGYFFNYFSMGVILSFITFLAGCFLIFLIKKNEQNN